MLNQMFADRLLAGVHTYLLAVYQQASEAARHDRVEEEYKKSQPVT